MSLKVFSSSLESLDQPSGARVTGVSRVLYDSTVPLVPVASDDHEGSTSRMVAMMPKTPVLLPFRAHGSPGMGARLRMDTAEIARFTAADHARALAEMVEENRRFPPAPPTPTKPDTTPIPGGGSTKTPPRP